MQETFISFVKRLICIWLLGTIPLHAAVQASEPKREDIDKRPGYQMPLDRLHPMWSVEQARPDNFTPQAGAIAFSPDGTYLAICTFPPINRSFVPQDPDGVLYILENPTARDVSSMKVHTITDQVMRPLGMNWLDDGLFIAERDEISRWTDDSGAGGAAQDKDDLLFRLDQR